MLFTFTYLLLQKLDIQNYLVSVYISIPIYFVLLHLSPLLQYYSAIIIGTDLFFFSNSIYTKKNIQKNKHKDLTNKFTNLANKYFDYLNKNDLKNKKIVKNYIKTKFDIKDTLQHTLNNISN